mmetsp:Transcript_78683/g.228356  ORF Transcript_78683/g.228356 Transcript_78683/m.228356 type:complete len:200 (-) Transcript_78683:454-1053(-)
MKAHLCGPLLGCEDLVEMRLVGEACRYPGGLHLDHELAQPSLVDVRREGVPVLIGDRPHKVQSADMLPLHHVPEQRGVDLGQLLRSLDERRDDLVRGAQRSEDMIFQAVDVVVGGGGTDLPPAAGALRHGVHWLLPAPADVEERQARRLLGFRRRALLTNLLRQYPLRDHVRVLDIQSVPAPVVPHGVQPLNLRPCLVV